MNVYKIFVLWLLLLMTGSVFGQKTEGVEKSAGLDFECFDENYILIDGRKYRHGSTAYICRGFGNLVIEAYHGSFPFDPFDSNETEWEGDLVIPYPNQPKYKTLLKHDMVSQGFNGIRASYPNNHGGPDHSVTVYVIVVGIEFTAANNQQFGFDENIYSYYTNQYGTGPAGIGPWKSTADNVGDKLKVESKPKSASDFKNVFFKMEGMPDVTISPNPAEASSQEIEFSGQIFSGEKLVSPITNIEGCYDKHYKSKANLVSYSPKFRKVGIIAVTEENDDVPIANTGDNVGPFEECIGKGNNNSFDSPILGDDGYGSDYIHAGANGICESVAVSQNINSPIGEALDVNALEIELNKRYASAVFSWEVTRLPSMTVDFDLDRDGVLYTPETFVSGEAAEIQLNCNSCFGYDNYIFLYDAGSSDGLCGYAHFSQSYGYAFPGVVTTGNTEIYRVIAHELGHCSFGLRHPDDDPANVTSPGIPTDWDNLMLGEGCDKPATANSGFRKYQWDIIQN